MLRLWNSLKAKMRSPITGMISLGFRGNTIVAIQVEFRKEDCCVIHIAEEMLPFIPFSNSEPSNDDCLAFARAIGRLAVSIPQKYLPMQVVLPDTAGIIQVMQFDALPESLEERELLAKFRLDKELPALREMQCAAQDISKINKPGLLLGSFFQRSWLDCLQDVCLQHGDIPSVVDMTITFLFNHFYDVVKATSGDGVLISIDHDSWSILFWDGDHRPRFVKSRMIDSSVSKQEEYEQIALEVERLILSYVLRVQRRRVEGIYICANEENRTLLASLLDVRMKLPCVQLDVTERCSSISGVDISNIPAGMLAVDLMRI